MTEFPVELCGASRTYGRVTALNDLSLRVPRGELLALLGPNGAGKSTAVSLMLGLRSPSAGTVRIVGGDPRDPQVRARIGAMLQESELPGVLRVRELIELFSRFYVAPLPVREVLNLTGLEDLAGKLTGQLSGGQRRRLVFALALVGDPRVLFLDEPTTGMDVQSREAFRNALLGLRERGRTVVLTTHDLEEAERLATRVAVIDHGSLLIEGSVAEVRAQVGASRVRFRATLTGTDLHSLPGVTHVSTDTGGLTTLHATRPEVVLAELFRQNAEVRDLEVIRASLEEAFVSLTGREAPTGRSRREVRA